MFLFGFSAKSFHSIRFIAFFSFSHVLLCGLFLQLVIIPVTPLHAGNGLLTGGDWVYFHDLATKIAELIAERGWKEWQLIPEGQAPAGIAALFYALTGVHQPWVVLPLHALLYALIAAFLYKITFLISDNELVGRFSLLPLYFFPSFAMVYGQLHKDIWAITGLMAVLWVWVSVMLQQRRSTGVFVLFLLALVLGNAVIFLVRPYALKIFLIAQAGMWCLLACSWWWHRNYSALLIGFIALLTTCCWLFVPLTGGTGEKEGIGRIGVIDVPKYQDWVYHLPLRAVDEQLAKLAQSRRNMAEGFKEAGSNLDVEIQFQSAADILRYIPRSIQVGMLAPFPTHWLGDARSPGGKFFRIIAAFEMLVLYVAFGGLALGAWLMLRSQDGLSAQRRLAVICLLFFTVTWIVIYELATVNMGSLYRVRLPVTLLWCSLGAMGWYLASRKQEA